MCSVRLFQSSAAFLFGERIIAVEKNLTIAFRVSDSAIRSVIFFDDTESGMTFHIQRRTLIQSELESAASIGVDPADVASAQPVSGGLCKVFGIHAGLNLTVFDVIAGTALGGARAERPLLGDRHSVQCNRTWMDIAAGRRRRPVHTLPAGG
ncbi:hypothetical protein Q1M63_18405 [Sinorhizobium meliloti]|nr:hypothetical protein Q1M63_18405 [Sinorhizobium meliloti]